MHLSFFLVAVVLALIGLAILIAAFKALAKRRPLVFMIRMLTALLLIAVAALLGMIKLGTMGYQALTKEEVAAWMTVEPAGQQHFTARLRFSDGRTASYVLAGDEVYVDAHILKWKPVANLFGLHTDYELDRVAGRYRNVGEEQIREHTVFPLGRSKLLDIFQLRKSFAMLSPLLDAEYGSASFVPVDRSVEWELRVSTSGLLFRKSGGTSR